jgi:S1-C subfamily serine protease
MSQFDSTFKLQTYKLNSKRSQEMKRKYLILRVMLMALLFLWGGTGLAFAQHKVLSSLEEDITSLVESIKPSLVTIETESYDRSLEKRKRLDIPATFVGSGIIYSSDGHILTTASVVGGMEIFKVTLPNRKVMRGKLVGTDDQSNVAVLKVEVKGLTPAKLGNSDKVRVGSWLTVVGNSFGLPNAVALGLVNGLREDGFIQMSANVSPGNSGGPVLDTHGDVIGLVSAKLSELSYINAIKIYGDKSDKQVFTIPPRQIELPSSGVSLALPINKVKIIADDIIKHGSVERGYLGIYPEDLDEKILEEYNTDKGVLVSEVVEESPAEDAGLLEDDIILEFGGKELRGVGELRYLILNARPKEKVRIKVLRDGKRIKLTAVLGKAKPQYGFFWKREEAYDQSQMIEEFKKAAYDQSQMIKELKGSTYNQLKEELNKLNQQIQRLSQELERLKQEKANE